MLTTENIEYVRRCKSKMSNALHKRRHAANCQTMETLCGIELNDMWWLERKTELTLADISCPNCLKIIQELGL